MATSEKSAGGSIVETIVIVAIAIGLALAIQAFIVKPYRIPSESMVPTLTIGQRVLVNRLGNNFTEPSVGDVIVFHPPTSAEDGSAEECGNADKPEDQGCDVVVRKESDTNFVKRVVAVAGDRISIRDGHVIRNGKRAEDDFISPCDGGEGCDLPRTFTVPKGHLYVMGDNRGQSRDSRFWGPLPREWVIGRAFATYWPPKRIGTL